MDGAARGPSPAEPPGLASPGVEGRGLPLLSHRIAEAGIEATGKHEGLLRHIAFNDWVTLGIQRAIERIQASLQEGLAFPATVGSTAPFIGLSARSGASTTRSRPSASPARRPSTRWPVRWARR